MSFNMPNSGVWATGATPYALPTYQPQGSPFSTSPYGYYNPGNMYGADRDWHNTPAIGGPGGYFENEPEMLFRHWIAPWASGQDPFSQYVQSQFSDVYDSYRTAFARNPSLDFRTFLSGFNPQFMASRWWERTPQQRGESGPLYGRGRLQWLV
jgi:hypothetical protein